MNTTKKKKRCKTMTVLMTQIEVYDISTGDKIGYGWLFHTDYGMTAPQLYDLQDVPMEPGWYSLKYKEDRLAVMTETIQ